MISITNVTDQLPLRSLYWITRAPTMLPYFTLRKHVSPTNTCALGDQGRTPPVRSSKSALDRRLYFPTTGRDSTTATSPANPRLNYFAVNCLAIPTFGSY